LNLKNLTLFKLDGWTPSIDSSHTKISFYIIYFFLFLASF